jgi:hypothetical protein
MMCKCRTASRPTNIHIVDHSPDSVDGTAGHVNVCLGGETANGPRINASTPHLPPHGIYKYIHEYKGRMQGEKGADPGKR